MTIERKPHLLIAIIGVCIVLIAAFTTIQGLKSDSEEKVVTSKLEGFVLTKDGIDKVKQNGDVLDTEKVLEKDNILRFEVVNDKTLVYSIGNNLNDISQVDVYTYNLDSKESQLVFKSSTDAFFTEMHTVGNKYVGVIENIPASNKSHIVLLDIATGIQTTVNSPAADQIISTWEPSLDGNTIIFKGSVYDVYSNDIAKNEINLIGTFDNEYGFLNNDTVWLSNLDGVKKMSVYSVKTKQTKVVKLDTSLVNKTFINGTILSADTDEKVLWLTSGFYDASVATQKIIVTNGISFEVLYDVSSNGYKYLNTVPSFNEPKKLFSLSTTDKYGNNIILILKTFDGSLVTTISGNQFVFTS